MEIKHRIMFGFYLGVKCVCLHEMESEEVICETTGFNEGLFDLGIGNWKVFFTLIFLLSSPFLPCVVFYRSKLGSKFNISKQRRKNEVMTKLETAKGQMKDKWHESFVRLSLSLPISLSVDTPEYTGEKTQTKGK